MAWLWTLLARGWRRNQIAHVVAHNQDYEAALRLEQKLIARFEPPFAQGRADTARTIGWAKNISAAHAS
jgi:hypothetical protein